LLLSAACEETRTNRPEDTGGAIDDSTGGGVPDAGSPDSGTADEGGTDTADGGVDAGDDTAQPADTEEDSGDTGTSSDVLGDVTTPDAGSDGDAGEPDATEDVGGGFPDLEPLGARGCTVDVTYDAPPGTTSVAMPGEFNEWNTTAWTLSDPDGDDVWTGSFDVTGKAPGAYGYKLLRNGSEWLFDPANPMRIFNGEFENSKIYIERCDVPLLVLEDLAVDAQQGKISAQVAVREGATVQGLVEGSALATHRGDPLPGTWDPASRRFYVELSSLAPGKHSLRFDVANAAGAAEPLWVPIWIDETTFDWRDAVLYFTFVDRFADGAPSPAPPCAPNTALTGWAGGDWVGLKDKIEEGYFDALGVDAIWLTAPTDSPDTCMSGDIKDIQYTAYHGYFPSSYFTAENQWGGMEALKAAVRAAHDRGIRVLVDLVLNHVHQDHPLFSEHADWFNPVCQCGFECPWDSKPEECWFQKYLPDFDFRKVGPVDAAMEMAVWWAREADLDGFRVDAVKHVHMHALTTLRSRIDALMKPSGLPFYMVGETFTGDWGGGNGANSEVLIKKYVAPTLLDGQFDFPHYWKIVRGFARNEEPLWSLGDYLEDSQGYYGSQSIMSSFLGNHDIPRFVSHAAGQIGDVWGNGSKEQGLYTPPPQPTQSEPYEKLRLAFSYLYCAAGIPLIYYGDEIGLAGAGDPDNRRKMVFDDWSAEQQKTFDHLAKLGGIRKELPPLSRGTTQVLASTNDSLVVVRRTAGTAVMCAFNRATSPLAINVDAPTEWASSQGLTDRLSGAPITAGPQLSLSVPARGALIIAP
jgi:glycosidase